MKRILPAFFSLFFITNLVAQTPRSYSSADILQQLKKLEVFGSVLYIAAHPDDENTRLLAYLANERRFRTGYLSLTRGDGGQNLIGDEQGIELGLIRTQELLAARRIDGAEQFFTRAYDFGYSKSPEETLQKWGHDKILSDVVWVIRKFKPDVIINRFPTTGEGGHGHHTASAMLAAEAFDAAADATRFPEQLTNGVTVWQAKRLLWNTFNFGGTNTQRDDQLKIDVGMYNPILGKSYGEMAAESRSQHKSQGFGVPAQRGESFEYFATIKGEKPVNDLMEGVDVNGKEGWASQIKGRTAEIIRQADISNPSTLTNMLVGFYQALQQLPASYWRDQKLKELAKLVEASSGIFMEAYVSNSPYAIIGDSLKINVTVNNRMGLNLGGAAASFAGNNVVISGLDKNKSNNRTISMQVPSNFSPSQPYWLQEEMSPGSFNISNQLLIGQPETATALVDFTVDINAVSFQFQKPLQYKYTDPVKGELYRPVVFVPAISLKSVPKTILVKDNSTTEYGLIAKAFADVDLSNAKDISVSKELDLKNSKVGTVKLNRGDEKIILQNSFKGTAGSTVQLNLDDEGVRYNKEIIEIKYDHIPAIEYFKTATTRIVKLDIKTAGKKVGFIAGAGDKVPEALQQMGYEVTFLTEKDIEKTNLKGLDAIVTGVRAHNTNAWLSNVYDVLMNYVSDGGVLLVQYNTNNSIGPVKAKISPYPFTITRNRVTDETAAVRFLLPNHPVLNYPNKISSKDFEGWIQERSIYNAESVDANYERILAMKDPGEGEQDGSLIVTNYGKGRFVYTGLVFFRELPAGVAGAYRLFANLIATPRADLRAGNVNASEK